MNETHVHVSSNDTWESMKRARKLYNTKIVVDDVYSARGRGAPFPPPPQLCILVGGVSSV